MYCSFGTESRAVTATSARTFRPAWLILLALPLAIACRDREPAQATEEPSSRSQLPPGHPPIGDGSSTSGIASVPPESGTGTDALEWHAPEEWIVEPPSSRMRRAQYRVPGEAGDAQCVVYYFGPGQGGDTASNAIRWAEQYTQPDGSSSRDKLKTRNIEVHGISVLMTEITGTYTTGSMMGGSSRSLPGYMLLGAIAKGPDANWFFKFTGPEKTVEANRAAFEGMIQSLDVGK